MITSLITLIPTFVMTLIFMVTGGIQSVNGSSNTTMGNVIPNATLPGVDDNYENDDEDRQAQNCQMPACPPGEMCIQVCPESVPK
ncbi:hypothetical protein BH18THE2_BH18THE2_28240 [soil metagenome]